MPCMRSSSSAPSTPSSRCIPPIPLLLLRPCASLPRVNHLVLSLRLGNLLGVAFGERQEVTEETSIRVDFKSLILACGDIAWLLVDIHLVRISVFPQSRRGGGRLEVFQLAPEPVQRCQNIGFVPPLFLPVFVPPSGTREQTALGVFRELFFQVGLGGFRFLFGVTRVGII
jgi:hypothetical protein